MCLDGDQILLTIPVHKTEMQGTLEYRALKCACSVRELSLCPWHAGERHQLRLAAREDYRSGQHYPLCPSTRGDTPAKKEVIACIRATLEKAGVQTIRNDTDGCQHQRFGGHAMRVSGAQFLAAAGVSTGLIQLLGRWTSTAVERYIQQAGLQVVPKVSMQALHGVDADSTARASGAALASPTSASRTPAVVAPATPSAQIAPVNSAAVVSLREAHSSLESLVQQLGADVQSLRHIVMAPETVLVVRCRSLVVHIGAPNEAQNNPSEWRTRCGWPYGVARFFRVQSVTPPYRPCKKCHHLDESSDSQDSHGDQADQPGSSASSDSHESDESG